MVRYLIVVIYQLVQNIKRDELSFWKVKILIIDHLLMILLWFLGVKMLAKLHSIDITKVDGLNQLTKSSRSKTNKSSTTNQSSNINNSSNINQSSNSSSNKGRRRGYYERMLNTMTKVRNERKREWSLITQYHPPFHPIYLFFNYRSIQINLHLFLYHLLSLFNLKMRFVINYHKLYQTE